jgi:hypothetical protein
MKSAQKRRKGVENHQGIGRRRRRSLTWVSGGGVLAITRVINSFAK